jgi:hypothetical protein
MTLLSRVAFLRSTRLWCHSVTPNFKVKSNAHSMCAQESSLHTYRTKNGFRIMNVTIYSIYYTNIILEKIKLITLEDTTAEILHNSIDNRLVVIARLALFIKKRQIFFRF